MTAHRRLAPDPRVLSAALIAVALLAGAWLLADALKTFKFGDRHVTVKGLAEREVQANLAIWPLAFAVTADELPALQAKLDEATQSVTAFLKLRGFEEDELSRSPPRITDYQAQNYGNRTPPAHYRAERSITVQSEQVEAVKSAMEAAGGLLGEDVLLAQNYGAEAQFLFTRLNRIKPEMIAEATANAREAAQRFARDSGSRVGSIRNARQGLFTIRERDSNSPDVKVVRMVSTIEFYLRD